MATRGLGILRGMAPSPGPKSASASDAKTFKGTKLYFLYHLAEYVGARTLHAAKGVNFLTVTLSSSKVYGCEPPLSKTLKRC